MMIQNNLHNLLIDGKIHSIIFDKLKYNQFHHDHLRVLPYNINNGSFEAYINNRIRVHSKTGIFSKIDLSNLDNKAIYMAYNIRFERGIPDGMSYIPPGVNITDLSPGSREDNFIISRRVLEEIYTSIITGSVTYAFKNERLPLQWIKELEIDRDKCFFDKKIIIGKGSLCQGCYNILTNELGYEIPAKYIDSGNPADKTM